MRSASLTAGGALLLMAVLGPFGYLVAVEGLVTPGDAAGTAADITAFGELVLAVWLLANAFTIPAPAHLLENGATR